MPPEESKFCAVEQKDVSCAEMFVLTDLRLKVKRKFKPDLRNETVKT